MFRHIKPVPCFTCTAQCLSWVSSQVATACGDPLGKSWQPKYFLNSCTMPQLIAHAPLFQNGERSVLSPSEKGEGQASEALILILLPFVCRGKGDQPSFTHLLSCSKPLQRSRDCLFARSQWKITPEWKTSTKLNLQIQNKQRNELLENHAGPCPREHHPFSAADILEWGPEAFYPQGNKQKKVYKAFCSSLSESHRSRCKPSFLGITPQPVFIILWYRNFQTKARHKTRFGIGISRSLVNAP